MKLERNFVLAIAALVCVAFSPSVTFAQTCTVADCPVGYNQITSPIFPGFFIGTSGSDCIIGTSGDETILGQGGDDYICGNAGVDDIIAGDGADTVFGGDGDDTIFGGAGDDIVSGEGGMDLVSGDGGFDAISGGDGDDTLLGGDDDDSVVGGDGDDFIDGGAGDDPFLSGGDGDDTIAGGSGDDTIAGGNGTDNLNGGLGNDSISGQAGPDIINGDDGDDTLLGGDDNDTLDGGDGADTLVGGSGYDNCLNAAVAFQCELFSHATLSSFDIISESSGAIARWVTSSESGTVGFVLSQKSNGEWKPLHEGVLPALLGSPQGGVYELRIPGDDGEYLLQEVDVSGRRNAHGPFNGSATRGAAQVISADVPYARAAHSLNVSRIVKANGAALESPGVATSVRLGVSKQGLYAVKADQIATILGLSAADVRAKILAGEYSLTESGNNVSWTAASDGSELFFVGIASDSIYSNERIYALEPATGTQMATVDAAPGSLAVSPSYLATQHFETNAVAGTLFAQDPQSDFWFWQLISATPSMLESATVPMELSNVITDRRDAELLVNIHGVTDSSHAVDVAVNGTPVGSIEFAGTVSFAQSITVAAGLLVEGANTVVLSPAGADDSMVFLNFAELRYEREFVAGSGAIEFASDATESLEVAGLGMTTRVFDISDANSPVELGNVALDGTNARFAVTNTATYFTTDAVDVPDSIWGDVPSSWRTETNNADYVLIAPAEFVGSASALADHRATQGYQVAIVELQDIYDEFSAGQADPYAVKAFVDYAHYNWDVPPRYVTMVGNGTLDFRDYNGLGGNFLPPLMVRTAQGIYASDMRFGDLESDSISDIAIGRLPVNNTSELDSVVAQLIAYDAQSEDRSDSVAFVADAIDPISDFSEASDGMADSLPSSFAVERVYRADEDILDFKANLRAAVATSPRVVNYLGHGGLTSLGKIDTLLDVADVATLDPGGEQPIYALMTCSASRFAVPGIKSLGEELLSSETGGVAVWGPSGLSVDNEAQIMATEFLRKAFEADGITLGEAIASAQAELLSNGGTEDMPAIYQLFGDPAMTVLPKAQVVDPGPGDMDGGIVDVSGTGLSGGSIGCAVGSSTQNSTGWLAMLFVLGAIVSRRRLHRHRHRR